MVLKIGVIGVGTIGKMHLQSYAACKDAKVVAIAEVVPELLKSVAKQYGIEKTFTDYHDLLALKEIEAVSICTPTFLHAPHTIAAAKAGKHVFCEKPMAMNYEEAKNMVDACEKAGVKLGICSARARTGSYPLSGDMEFVKSYVPKLGQIYYAKISGPSRFRGRPGLDILKASKWFLDSSKAGGGVLADLGCYSMDLLLYLMGNPQPAAVSAFTFRGVGEKTKVQEIYDVEEHATLFIRFKEDFVAAFDVANASNMWRDDIFSLTLFGTKGGLKLEGIVNVEARVTYFTEQKGRRDITEVKIRDQPGRQGLTVDLPPSRKNMHEDFVAACLEDSEPATPGIEGLKIVQVTSMAYMSADLGKEVALKDLESQSKKY